MIFLRGAEAFGQVPFVVASAPANTRIGRTRGFTGCFRVGPRRRSQWARRDAEIDLLRQANLRFRMVASSSNSSVQGVTRRRRRSHSQRPGRHRVHCRTAEKIGADFAACRRLGGMVLGSRSYRQLFANLTGKSEQLAGIFRDFDLIIHTGHISLGIDSMIQ